MDACVLTVDLFTHIVDKYTDDDTRQIITFVCREFSADLRDIEVNYVDLYKYSHKIARIPLIKWCLDVGCPVVQSASAIVVAGGKLETIRWLHSRSLLFEWDLMDVAIKTERDDVIDFLHNAGFNNNESLEVYYMNKLRLYQVGSTEYNFAEYKLSVCIGENTQINVVYESDSELINKFLINSKLETDAEKYKDTLIWCINNKCFNLLNAITLSIRYGNVNILAQLLEIIHTDITGKLCKERFGHSIAMIDYCCSNNLINIELFVVDKIGVIGNIGLLKWYLNNGGIWNAVIYAKALKYGHFDFIAYCDEQKYNHKNSCAVCYNALKYCSFELFLKLYGEGCIFSRGCEELCKYDSAKVIKFIEDNGWDDRVRISHITNGAVEYGNIDMLNYLMDGIYDGHLDDFLEDFNANFNTENAVKVFWWYINRGFRYKNFCKEILNCNNVDLLKLLCITKHPTLIMILPINKPIDEVVLRYALKIGWKISVEDKYEYETKYSCMLEYYEKYLGRIYSM
jgi:hypothetical protein